MAQGPPRPEQIVRVQGRGVCRVGSFRGAGTARGRGQHAGAGPARGAWPARGQGQRLFRPLLSAGTGPSLRVRLCN